MINTVIKGTDDELEFKGFKGRYLYMLAIGTISLIMLTFLLFAIGFSSLILLVIFFSFGIGMYFYVKILMNRYGKWGHIQSKHKGAKPHALIQNMPFYKMIK